MNSLSRRSVAVSSMTSVMAWCPIIVMATVLAQRI
jgi:hypothetical protein